MVRMLPFWDFSGQWRILQKQLKANLKSLSNGVDDIICQSSTTVNNKTSCLKQKQKSAD